MTNVLLAKPASQSGDITKLLCDTLSVFSSYLMDETPYPAIMDRLHSLDKSSLPFDVDEVFEHMYRLKDDMIDEHNK
jgi:hypothetical protein